MKNQRNRRPSPALVISVIALICALTGTAWAALGKNSVGSKQLKKNAVTAAKIKKNAVTTAKIKKEAVAAGKIKKATITGKQINFKKLGTVPTAQLANTIPAAEPTHLVGAPGEPGFESGSSNVGVLPESSVRFNNVGFFKDHDGLVHLEGVAQAGVGGASGIASLFTLPAGYRPAQGTVIIVPKSPLAPESTGAGGLIGGSNTIAAGIDLSGKVVGLEKEIVVLDGLVYRPGS
jgi:hypothetical protein